MDANLLKQLYKQYYNEIYLYIYSLCKNTCIAEDIAHDTFLKALLSLKNDHTNMRAWLYMVGRNLYFNYRKKNERNISLDENTDINENINDGTIPDPVEAMLKEERARLLYKALANIDEKYREVMNLYYFGELSQKEISNVLMLSPENVRVLLHRGKKQLKQQLEDLNYEI